MKGMRLAHRGADERRRSYPIDAIPRRASNKGPKGRTLSRDLPGSREHCEPRGRRTFRRVVPTQLNV